MQIEFLEEKVIVINDDETILHASLAAGIPHFHLCGGNAKCSTCRILVVEGAESLTSPNENEKTLKSRMNLPLNVRLACQTKVTKDNVRVRRIIQDETDISLYVGGDRSGRQDLGEEMELALFFLDIRNFTRVVELHPAFDVVHIIQKLFSVFQKIIEEYSGRILETAGDGFYAVFGYDLRDENEIAQRAVDAAMKALSNLKELNQKYFVAHFDENVEVGIGIHVGKVVSGTIKIANEGRQIVMGYPVNIASRLQDATKELNNNLIVSSDVYQRLANPPVVESRIILAKGISLPIAVYPLGVPYFYVQNKDV